jgi:hypothetical protein
MTWLTILEYQYHKISLICSTCRRHFPVFPHSLLITGFVTRLIRRVPLLEQELFTLQEQLRSPTILSRVRVTRSLILCACFVHRCLSFCHFVLVIVLSVLRFTDSYYPFGSFKLFLVIVYIF